MSATDVNQTAHLVRTRKSFRCDGFRCATTVQKGDDYVRAVAFPGHDANGGTQPWVMKLCVDCATQYDRPLPRRRANVNERNS